MQNSSDLRKIKEYQYQHESIKILSFSHLMNYLTKKPSKHSLWTIPSIEHSLFNH